MKIRVTIDIPDRLAKPLLFLLLIYRRIRYGCAFRKIPLTQGKFAVVDPEDFDRLARYKWYAAKNNNTFYAVRSSWLKPERKKIKIKMHRVILNAPTGLIVDHINHNGLDNRKANLRLATAAQNARNSLKRRNLSGYKGVCYAKKRKKYRAVIWHNNKRIHLGYFNSKTAAALEYDRAAKKYHKEFASYNLPQSNHYKKTPPV